MMVGIILYQLQELPYPLVHTDLMLREHRNVWGALIDFVGNIITAFPKSLFLAG
jgi:hypothetical protein